jgi:RNA polymerase sigma factor (sigma-70 family)
MADALPPEKTPVSRPTDEELLIAAQRDGCLEARDGLIHRYQELLRRYTQNLTRRMHLPTDVAQDLRQDAFLIFTECINKYDVRQATVAAGCRFGSFVYRNLASHFYNRRQRLVWEAGHLRRDMDLDALLEPKRGHRSGPTTIPPSPDMDEADPAQAAVNQEEIEAVRQELATLPSAEVALWRAAANRGLKLLAKNWDTSYRTLKRRLHALRSKLGRRLGGQ